MAYGEWAPEPRLRGLVECGWSAVLTSDEPSHIHDVLPDGCMDLIRLDGELIVAGPDTAPHRVSRLAGASTVGLRFAPGVLPGLTGVPAAEVRDRRVPLVDLLPRFARSVGPGRTLTEIAAGLPGQGFVDRAVSAVAARLGAGDGVAVTADALGWTTRTLHRRCLESFGYGPAMLRRILRFRRAIALLHAGVAPAAVAAAAGYADQPHLSREVRVFAGVSPGRMGVGEGSSSP